ncbi:hypothetical protein L6164_015425 [Bauhinia variegata]|uniref:Uncharacterized protein n=1 Tax=Bauhinia variegata TaxID=167791 RepID=A0ACB9NLC7_BAUVA|nr:hypothetical protein L6164_015425 [Bauhinia variegata]
MNNICELSDTQFIVLVGCRIQLPNHNVIPDRDVDYSYQVPARWRRSTQQFLTLSMVVPLLSLTRQFLILTLTLYPQVALMQVSRLNTMSATDEADKAGCAALAAGKLDEALHSLNISLSKCPPDKISELFLSSCSLPSYLNHPI